VISIKPDGGVRPSIYWKMSCEDGRNARALKHAG